MTADDDRCGLPAIGLAVCVGDQCAQPAATVALAVTLGALVGLAPFVPLAIHATHYLRNHYPRKG